MSEPTGFEAFWPEGVGDQVVRSFARGAWDAAVASQQAEIEDIREQWRLTNVDQLLTEAQLADARAENKRWEESASEWYRAELAKLSAVVEAAREVLSAITPQDRVLWSDSVTRLADSIAALEEKPAE